MKRMLQTMGYLIKSIVKPTLLALVVMIIMLAIIDFTIISMGRLSSNEPLTMPLEFVSGGLSLLIGAVLFLTNFRVSLANGISRKTFMLANLAVAILIAAIFAIATQVLTEVHALFWPINTFSVAMLIANPQVNQTWPLVYHGLLSLHQMGQGVHFIRAFGGVLLYVERDKWEKWRILSADEQFTSFDSAAREFDQVFGFRISGDAFLDLAGDLPCAAQGLKFQ